MWARSSVVVLGVALGMVARGQEPPRTGPIKSVAGSWEVRYTDDSTMKLTLLEDTLSLLTPHGTLQIPVRDIKKIEFGARLSEADQKAVDAAITDLASTETTKREAAKTALAEIGPKALPAVTRAARPLTGPARVPFTQVTDSLMAKLASGKQPPRDTDVIHTEESVIAGRLALATLRVNTFQFGEQKLKVTDVTVMQFGKLTSGVASVENLEMIDPSAVLPSALRMVGKTVGVRVTGALGGSVWGSGPYTSDSNIATAAIHAGVLKAGETGVVKVRFVPSPQGFLGTSANGVESMNYGPFGSGSYEIIRTP